MAMDRETKTEVVLFSIIAGVLIILWWLNRQHGIGGSAGAVPDIVLPSTGGLGPTGARDGPSFSIGGSVFNVPPPDRMNANGSIAGACGCSDASSMLQFGSREDLTSFLASVPDLVEQAASGINDYY